MKRQRHDTIAENVSYIVSASRSSLYNKTPHLMSIAIRRRFFQCGRMMMWWSISRGAAMTRRSSWRGRLWRTEIIVVWSIFPSSQYGDNSSGSVVYVLCITPHTTTSNKRKHATKHPASAEYGCCFSMRNRTRHHRVPRAAFWFWHSAYIYYIHINTRMSTIVVIYRWYQPESQSSSSRPQQQPPQRQCVRMLILNKLRA